MRGLLASRPAVVDRTRCGTILLWYNMRHSSSCTFFFLFKEASSRLWQYLLAFFFFPSSLTFYVLPPLVAQEVGMRRGDLLFAHLPLHVFLWYVTASAVAFAVVRSIPQHAKTKPAV